MPFDSDYVNVVRFDNRAAQEEFFGLPARFEGAPYINFNAGTLMRTTIMLPHNNTEGFFDLLGVNYAIIKDNAAADGQPAYFYYFVESATYDAGKQAFFTLKLDVYQTYYIDCVFGDCFIEKAHLNRFIDIGEGKVRFDFTPDSLLFEREEVRELPKRLTQRNKIRVENPTNTAYNEWEKANIKGWLYYYVSPGSYEGYTVVGSLEKTENGLRVGTDIGSAYLANIWGVFCEPIYNTKVVDGNEVVTGLLYLAKNVPTGDGGSTKVNFELVKNGIGIIGGRDFVYQLKYSNVSPFSGLNITGSIIDGNFVIDELDFLKIEPDSESPILPADSGNIPNVQPGFLNLHYDLSRITTLSEEIDLATEIDFQKSEIIGAARNKKFNPKLLSADFKEFRLCAGVDSFSYAIDKIGQTKGIKLLYNEGFAPDITRGYLRISAPGKYGYESLYIEGTESNFTGLVYSVDYSLPYSVSQLEAFLANNKNYYLQRNNQYKLQELNAGLGLAGSLFGVGSALASGNISGAVSGAVGGALSFGGSMASLEAQKINDDLTIDNMASAPQTLNNANGNFLLNEAVNGAGIFYEIYEGIDSELAAADDMMYLYGYRYNRIDNIKNVDNVRKHFNFVKAIVNTVYVPYNLPVEAHEELKRIFAAGIRMWNSTNIDEPLVNYSLENYERWLENG